MENDTGAAAICCNLKNKLVSEELGIKKAGINVKYAKMKVITFDIFNILLSSASGLICVL